MDSLVFDVWAFFLFFDGTAFRSSGIVLLTSVSGLPSARALRGRLVVVVIVAVVCLFWLLINRETSNHSRDVDIK